MKYKILIFLLSVSYLFGGCSNIKQTKIRTYNNTKAKVLEVQYREPRVITFFNTETQMEYSITYDEDYSTFIKYNNTVYNLDSQEAYILCKDKINQEIAVDYIEIYNNNNEKIDEYISIGGHR